MNVQPKYRALLYISSTLSIFLAPKFCPTIDNTAVFNPKTGSKNICSYLIAVP